MKSEGKYYMKITNINQLDLTSSLYTYAVFNNNLLPITYYLLPKYECLYNKSK